MRLVSKRIILSYVLDWIVIVAIAGAGGALSLVSNGYERPFSLLDLSISYPIVPESITTGILALVCLAAPALIILAVIAIFVPGPGTVRRMKRRDVIALKLWEFEKGWAGLALSIATAFFATQALKNMFGKPRPNSIATCQPDLTNIAKYVVGGFGQDISPRWTLVTAKICTKSIGDVQHAFRSFPSGHSSFSWSGMLYLTLFLCSKFAISVPYLPPQPSTLTTTGSRSSERLELLPLHHRAESSGEGGSPKPQDVPSAPNGPNIAPVRNQAASPPIYLLVLAFVPIAVAIYICSTRYVEFYHHGFDIIAGAFVGILTSWLSFRWYHLPVGRGEGWAYGPRSRDRAFGIGVGVSGFVGPEGWHSKKASESTAA